MRSYTVQVMTPTYTYVTLMAQDEVDAKERVAMEGTKLLKIEKGEPCHYDEEVVGCELTEPAPFKKTYAVKLSDGEAEWTEKFSAENEDHLMDIIDSEGWDVVDYKEVK